MGTLLMNPFWEALTTEQSGLAIGSGPVRRFSAEVIPFAGMAESSTDAMHALRDLLAPGESLYVVGDKLAACPGLESVRVLPGLQMHFQGRDRPFPASRQAEGPRVELLREENASEMVALTDVAFPGFFRPRSHVLGTFLGLRDGGTLVAMVGERLAVPGAREVSAVCTHPAHTGRGHAELLLRHLLRLHTERAGAVLFHQLRRPAD